MSTATTPRKIEVQAGHYDGTVAIRISERGDIGVVSADASVSGKADCFELMIIQRLDPRQGHFAFIGCESDISLMIFLTPEGAEAIHATIPEIKFFDERVEVQP
jgi:hypothetical protein